MPSQEDRSLSSRAELARVPVGDPFGQSGHGHLEVVPQDPLSGLGCDLDPPRAVQEERPFRLRLVHRRKRRS
jgi:hypothetical protein